MQTLQPLRPVSAGLGVGDCEADDACARAPYTQQGRSAVRGLVELHHNLRRRGGSVKVKTPRSHSPTLDCCLTWRMIDFR
eukprot:3934946-Rhodomonas_salina.8